MVNNRERSERSVAHLESPTLKSKIVKIVDGVPNKDAIELLEEYLERAKKGEIKAVGIIARDGQRFFSSFSKSDNCIIDSGLLIQLALRRMGFEHNDD